jgi:hypothetical protein
MDFSNQTKTTGKNAPTEKSQDFFLTFMNSMEDGRRNPGSRPWTFKTRENPGPTVNTNSGNAFHTGPDLDPKK